MSLYTGNEGNFLEPAVANQLTKAYHQRKVDAGVKDSEVIDSEFFGIEKLRQLLDQPGAVGIRVHHARNWEDADGNPKTANDGRLTPRVVLTAVDKDGNTLGLSAEGPEKTPSAVSFLAQGPLCPPQCGGGGSDN